MSTLNIFSTRQALWNFVLAYIGFFLLLASTLVSYHWPMRPIKVYPPPCHHMSSQNSWSRWNVPRGNFCNWKFGSYLRMYGTYVYFEMNMAMEWIMFQEIKGNNIEPRYTYTGCPGGAVPDFRRIFLKLNYTDITQNSYIRSWTVTEIMAREKCGLLAVPCTVPGLRDVLPYTAHVRPCLQPAQARSRWDCTCKVLGNLRTTTT